MRAFIPILTLSCVLSQLTSYAGTTTTTALAVNPNPVTLSQLVTLTATVTPSGASGNVEFLDGAVPLGAAVLAGGVATLRTPDLTSGQHALRARFKGTGSYAGSVSSAVSLNVKSVAGGGFLAATTISQPNGGLVISADFNNDGLLDLVSTDQAYNLYFQLGQGGGKYAAATLLDANLGPRKIIAGDFNGDGHLDIAALGNGMVVFLGNGDGTFQPPLAPLEPTLAFYSGVLGDFNNDGIPDLVAVTIGQTGIYQTSVYLGDGDGTFRFSTSLATGNSALATGDFDGDGNTDVAVSGLGDSVGGLTIFFGNGSAGFTSLTFPTALSGDVALATGDLNGDGIDDLVSLSYSGTGPYSLQVILGAASRILSPSAPLPCDSEPAMALSDFNGDGKLDVMVADSPPFAALFLGNGDGTLQPEAPVFVSLNYNEFGTPSFLDWDGDGRLDIYDPGAFGSAYIFLGAPPTTTSITVSPLSGLENQNLNVSSSVSPASASGTVTFVNNTTPVLFVNSIETNEPLVGGTASGQVFPNLGANYVFAIYSGDATHASSYSPIVVSNLYIDTSVTLSSNLSTQIVGQPVTFTATATLNPNEPPVGGRVTLYDGIDVIAVGAVTNAQAVLSVEFSTAGTHNIVARYENQPGFVASTSAAVPVSITEASGGTLQSGESLTTSSVPSAIGVADVDGDGSLDLISGSSSSSALEVFLGHAGEFLTPLTTMTSLPGVQAIAISDFYLNGKPDIVVASSSTGSIQLLTGNGDGTFNPVPALTTLSIPTSLAVADFNGDGAPDLVIGYASGSNVSIALNVPGAGFSQLTSVPAGSAPYAVTVGDFNGDGNADIAAADLNANTVSILLGNGDGTFRTTSPFPTGLQPVAIAAGDLDGDGKTDLVVASASSNSLVVLYGNGDGTFTEASQISIGAPPAAVALADLNGDGQMDIAVVAGGQLLVLYGSSRSFGAPVTIGPADTNSSALALGAIDGQGHIDVVSSSAAGNNVEIFLDDALTATTLAAESPTVLFGRPVTLTATVAPANYAGSVSFFDGPNLLGSARASGGKAVFKTSVSQPGGHKFTAETVLNASGLSSKSNSVPVTVTVLPSASLGIPTQVTPFLQNAFRTVTADINNDGKPDLIYISTGGAIWIALGNGAGTFGTPLEAITSAADVFFVGDFNEDGNPDILFFRYEGMGPTQIAFGSGDGTFGSPVTIASNPNPIAIADLNHDGHMDLINLGVDGTPITVSLGYGDGTFRAEITTPLPSQLDYLVVADFNQDGNLDIAFDNTQQNIVIMFGRGDGTFGAANTFYVGPSPGQLSVGDFDGDGYPDLAVLDPIADSVIQLFNDETGSFPADLQVVYPITALQNATIADLNGDGLPDLICTPYGASSVYILLNDGTGLFDYYYEFAGVPTSAQPSVADFNSDGVPDLLLSGSTASLLLGSQSFLQLSSGDNQASIGGTPFNELLVYGPVGEPVTFTVPSSGPSASFQYPGNPATTYNTTVNNDNGVASSGSLVPNSIQGAFTVSAIPTGDTSPQDSVVFHLSNGCSDSLSSTALAASSAGATIAVAIYGAQQCSWTATSNMPGVTLSPASGSGTGTVLVVLPPNTGTSDVTGTVTIAGQTLPVTIDFTSQSFNDVPPGSYDFDAVNLLAAKGVTTGCAAGEFCPN